MFASVLESVENHGGSCRKGERSESVQKDSVMSVESSSWRESLIFEIIYSSILVFCT